MIKYNSDWATFTLKDVCTRITDGSHYSPKSVENGLPMASVKDLTPFGINLESCRLISKDDFSALAYQDCKPIVGDVLISKDGASALDTVCEVKQEVDVVLLSSVAILRPDINKIIPAYLRYYLDAESTRKYLKDVFITGAAIPRIVLKDFKRAEIRLPPLPEQRAIARILGSLDDKIELNRRMNETLEAIARAIFKSWFVDFDPVRAKAEGREPAGMDAETAALFPDSFEETELGMVPRGWMVKTIGDVLDLAYGKALKEDCRMPGKIPVYGSNGQVGWHNEKIADGPGIIVGRKGNPGTVTWSQPDFFSIDTTFYVKPKSLCKSMFYLFFSLRKQNLSSLGADSAVPGLNRNLAYMSKMLVPSWMVLEAFNKHIELIYEMIYVNDEQSHNIADIRDLLLLKLISGEIQVKNMKNAMIEGIG